jgi:hypothetical protein
MKELVQSALWRSNEPTDTFEERIGIMLWLKLGQEQREIHHKNAAL